ncbi:MAG: DUF348 domain-containing protein [Ruminococcaceae bacterium]|nr:DUF348 domain-containing protein [Oscillospiraceae bacterium]
MSLLSKFKIKCLQSRKLLIMGIMVILMMAVTAVTLAMAANWEVTLYDGAKTFSVKTTKTTVGDVLEEANIVLEPQDVVVPEKSTPISEAKKIEIKRAFEITVSDIDGEKVYKTAYDTVEDALMQCDIILDENDEVYPPLDSKILAGDLISVSRVEISEITEQQEIEYEVIEEKTDKIIKGIKRLVTGGENGLANVTYKLITKNGVLAEKQEVSREILREPVNRVIAVGTSEIANAPVAKLASRSGSTFDKSQARVITCTATAYDGSYETLGYSNARTCLGKIPTVGTVAVDPKVIPLGTRMYIESVDGSYVYGECFAGDTGGAIKGNRVDLFMASRSQALSFGRRQVKVYILD